MAVIKAIFDLKRQGPFYKDIGDDTDRCMVDFGGIPHRCFIYWYHLAGLDFDPFC